MKLYVVRHGRTNCNDEGKYNGKLDEDINETGIKQAEEARKKVEKLDIDLIICSPLLRTKHTCNIINANNIPIIYDKRLEERDCGKLTNEKLGEFYYTDYWNYYSNKKISGNITFNYVELSYYMEKLKDGSYALKPVWVFLSLDDMLITYHSDVYPNELLIIDAENGTPIDIK